PCQQNALAPAIAPVALADLVRLLGEHEGFAPRARGQQAERRLADLVKISDCAAALQVVEMPADLLGQRAAIRKAQRSDVLLQPKPLNLVTVQRRVANK